MSEVKTLIREDDFDIKLVFSILSNLFDLVGLLVLTKIHVILKHCRHLSFGARGKRAGVPLFYRDD